MAEQVKVNGCIFCLFGQTPRNEHCDCDNHGPVYGDIHGPNAYTTCPVCHSAETDFSEYRQDNKVAKCRSCGRTHRWDSEAEEWR